MTIFSRRILLFAVLAGTLATGCRSASSDSPFFRAPNTSVQIQVENSHFNQVTISAIVSGTHYRLGDVTGLGSETFTIDPEKITLDQGLRFSVDPLGSNRGFLSNTVFPNPGSTVMLTVASQVGMSYLTIR